MIRALVSPPPTPDTRSVHPTADDSEPTRFCREHVGFVFHFYNLIPCLAALEHVALVTEIAERPMNPLAALCLVEHINRQNHFPP